MGRTQQRSESCSIAGGGPHAPDTHKDYGEIRMPCYGKLEGRMIVIGYTPRGADRHIFSMRKAN
jgi:uncharacterized DUF497 family protein